MYREGNMAERSTACSLGIPLVKKKVAAGSVKR
jgi:hypothetical protein